MHESRVEAYKNEKHYHVSISKEKINKLAHRLSSTSTKDKFRDSSLSIKSKKCMTG